MITSRAGEVCRFVAFTPDGKGIWLRQENLPTKAFIV
jgi:hypothetical protein